MGSAKNRILYWDVIKCFAIFLVIWQHCLKNMVGDDEWTDPVNKFIVSFHMPLFMIVSGYFARSVFKKGVIETLIKKGFQLVLPSISFYFLVGIILIVVRHNMAFVDALMSLLDYCCASFWFLKALFVFYVLTTVFIKLWRRSKILLLTLIILGGAIIPPNWLNYVNCMAMYPFFLMGLIYFYHEDFILKYKKVFFCSLFVVYVTMTYFNDVADYQMYTHLFTWNLQSILIFIIRTVIGISGGLVFILFIRSTCKKIEANNLLAVMADIGSCTLGIYVFQYYMVERALFMTRTRYQEALFSLDNIFVDLIVAPVYSLIALFLCWKLVKLVRYNKLAKLIILGEK